MHFRGARGSLAILSLALLALATACEHDTEQGAEPAPLPDSAFKVEWGAATIPPSLKPGEKVVVSVTFKNASTQTWPDSKTAGGKPPGSGAVRLSYRWWPPSSPLATPYTVRADLTTPLKPGASATLPIAVIAPNAPGDYRLQFDLVDELVAWFEEKGASKLIEPVAVR